MALSKKDLEAIAFTMGKVKLKTNTAGGMAALDMFTAELEVSFPTMDSSAFMLGILKAQGFNLVHTTSDAYVMVKEARGIVPTQTRTVKR
jgi:hypothetical protein